MLVWLSKNWSLPPQSRLTQPVQSQLTNMITCTRIGNRLSQANLFACDITIRSKLAGITTTIWRVVFSLYWRAQNSALVYIYLTALSTLSMTFTASLTELFRFDDRRTWWDYPWGKPCTTDWWPIHIFIPIMITIRVSWQSGPEVVK